MSRNLRRIAAAIALAVGMVLFASVFFKFGLEGSRPKLTPRFDLVDFAHQLPRQLPWVLPFIFFSALVLPARAVQWQSTLSHRVPFKERYHLVAIGALVQNTIPGNLGDAFRSLAMARVQKLPFIHAFGSVLVGKLLELANLLVLLGFSFLGPLSQRLGGFATGVKVAFGVCMGLMVLVLLLARYAGKLGETLGRHGKWRRTATFLFEVNAGLASARSGRRLAWAFALSLPPVLSPAIGYGLGLQALGVPDGIFGGALVLGAIMLGHVTPGVPTGPGLYYFLCAGVARQLGVSAIDAAAFAMLTHLGTIGTQLAIGAVSMLTRKLRLSELKRSARKAAEGLREEQRTA